MGQYVQPDTVFALADAREALRDPWAKYRAAIHAQIERQNAAWAEEMARMHALGAEWDSARRRWLMPDGEWAESAVRESVRIGRPPQVKEPKRRKPALGRGR